MLDLTPAQSTIFEKFSHILQRSSYTKKRYRGLFYATILAYIDVDNNLSAGV